LNFRFPPSAFVDEWPVDGVFGDMLSEVVDGRVVEKPNSAYSMWIASQLASSMSKAVKHTAGGTLLLHALIAFDTMNRRRPDLVYFGPEKWPAHTPPPRYGDCALIPDLAAEVLTWDCDRPTALEKIQEFLEAGIGEVWLLDPHERAVSFFGSSGYQRRIDLHGALRTLQIPSWSVELQKLMPHATEPPRGADRCVSAPGTSS
jgi:Uma2 family endonuclease